MTFDEQDREKINKDTVDDNLSPGFQERLDTEVPESDDLPHEKEEGFSETIESEEVDPAGEMPKYRDEIT